MAAHWVEGTCESCGRPPWLHKQSSRKNHMWARILCNPAHPTGPVWDKRRDTPPQAFDSR